MPTSAEHAYETPSRDQRSGSVYDFLYHDARRIASFLSQFEEYGNPQSVKAMEAEAETGSTKTYGSAGGGVPGVAQGQAGMEKIAGTESRNAAEWTFDPLWRNAIRFLNYLEERNMIARDPAKANIGQFVLASGSLTILDLVMLKSAWGLPAIQGQIRAGADVNTPSLNRRQKRALAHQGKIAQKPSNVDMLIELLSIFPHSVQAQLAGTSDKIWCTLSTEALVGQSSDLLLKHGVSVPGDWSILGILDAKPQPRPPEEEDDEEWTLDSPESLVGRLATTLAPIVRNVVGRPYATYGVTALLIFRRVSG